MCALKLINLWQTNEERWGKYHLARLMGANSYQAIRMRDWRLSKIERLFGLDQTYNPHTKTYDRDIALTLKNASQCSVEAYNNRLGLSEVWTKSSPGF